MIKKRCTKCGKAKLLKFFGLDERNGKSYVLSRCKSCVAANTRAWKQRNLERAREYQKAYRQTEKAKADNRAGNKRYREIPENAEKIRSYRRRWAQTENGRAALLRARLKWLDKNPDQISFYPYLVSLDAPVKSNKGVGRLLDIVADDKAVNPLEHLIQSEAVIEVAQRVVRERGCSWDTAVAIIEAHI